MYLARPGRLSGSQKTGVRNISICMTLVTIWVTSRKRVQTSPSAMPSACALIEQEQEGRNEEQRRPGQGNAGPDRHRHIQDDLVRELDQVARHAPPDEQADRKVALLEVVAPSR